MQRASSRAVCCTGDALRNRSVERGHGGGGGRWSVVGCGRSEWSSLATKYGRERSSWNPVWHLLLSIILDGCWPRCLAPLWLEFGGWLRGVVGTRFCPHHRRPPPASAAPLDSGLGLATPSAVPDPSACLFQ